MVKTILSVALFGLCAGAVKAQDTLQVQGTAPNLYITHVVKKGENFYSIGRAYGISPKEIASANKISMDQGLQLGHAVHIPLTAANFSQKADAGGQPVYHKVEGKETLYRVSVNYNKVPLANIRQWNGFSGDGLKKDSYLIIGYLKSGGVAPAKKEKEPAPAPVATTPEPASTPAPEQPKKEVAKKEKQKEQAPPPATETHDTAPAPAPAAPVVTSTGGSFEELYEQQTKGGKKVTAEKGPGTWFKSNAVGKYYALHNSAPRGTIIKVTNPLNGKAVYAKVLDVIPQMKSNAGLIIKLSDSAMQALGSSDAKFYCELSYEN
ncbi:LysM peptidoglycan-binding domain-containing protein [Chitinophaga vietnamensis]|uniref:LysM peptidoglycan-binding domain-containing protein n=1 Tax=Chitinophaga vietnamensis TaxID=2593957 RepID=UPI0013764552|nr:LysM peptidoglycan-binding domain-containing protein [Chitinophaga vietnamensis]